MKRISILLLSCAALFAACNPAEIPGEIYNGPSFVYFKEATFQGVTLTRQSSPKAVYTNEVLVGGEYGDYERENDRTYKLELVLSPEIEDDYDITQLCAFEPGEDVITIPAGELSSSCRFHVWNKSEYLTLHKGKNIKILLKIVATGDFSLGFGKQVREYELQVAGNY